MKKKKRRKRKVNEILVLELKIYIPNLKHGMRSIIVERNQYLKQNL